MAGLRAGRVTFDDGQRIEHRAEIGQRARAGRKTRIDHMRVVVDDRIRRATHAGRSTNLDLSPLGFRKIPYTRKLSVTERFVLPQQAEAVEALTEAAASA